MTTTDEMRLDKHAYQGAPRPLGNNVLGQDALAKLEPEPRWEYKSRKQRRQEIIDSM